MPPVLDRDARHVSLIRSVQVVVAHGGHRQHRDGVLRVGTLVGDIPHLVQNRLSGQRLTYPVRPCHQHDVEQTRRNVRPGDLDSTGSGCTSVVDAHDRLSGGPDRFDEPTLAIAYADECIGCEGNDHRLDVVHGQPGIIECEQCTLANEFGIRDVGSCLDEVGLADTDDSYVAHGLTPPRDRTEGRLWILGPRTRGWRRRLRVLARRADSGTSPAGRRAR